MDGGFNSTLPVYQEPLCKSTLFHLYLFRRNLYLVPLIKQCLFSNELYAVYTISSVPVLAGTSIESPLFNSTCLARTSIPSPLFKRTCLQEPLFSPTYSTVPVYRNLYSVPLIQQYLFTGTSILSPLFNSTCLQEPLFCPPYSTVPVYRNLYSAPLFNSTCLQEPLFSPLIQQYLFTGTSIQPPYSTVPVYRNLYSAPLFNSTC